MLEPLTILEPIPFGRHRDGTPAAASMREQCVAIVGTPGSGKTVVEQCFIAGLVRCPDALVWPIDMSNGGLTNPWLNPWLDGDMPRPVLDWPAYTAAEALAMTDAALRIIDARRLAYRRLMRHHNTDKLPVSHDIPAIYLLLDEGKEATGVTGNQKLIRNLIRIADKGRAVAVRIIITGLRGTSEVIPTEMMADIGARICMRIAAPQEMNHVLGWQMKYNPRDYPYPGCGLWRPGLDAGAPDRFRSFDLSKPATIERIAWACEPWRPSLDEPSLAALGPHLGELYLSRWERARALLLSDDLGEPSGSLVSPAGESPPSPTHLGSPPAAGAGSPGLTAMAQAVNRAKRAVNAQRLTGPRVDQAWAQLADQLDADRAAGGPGWFDPDPTAGADPRERMRELLDTAGPAGTSGPKLQEALAAEGHDVPTATLYRWLNADAVDGGYGAWRPRKDQDR